MVRTFLLDIYDNLYKYLFEWQSEFLIFKIISAALSLWLLILIIFLIKKLWALLTPLKVETAEIFQPAIEMDKIAKEWERIIQALQKRDEANSKISIIEADKLLDEILQRAGFLGKDMGERLEGINSAQISNIDAIWQAHKIRNKIAHEPNFKLTPLEAESAIRIYEAALKELEVL